LTDQLEEATHPHRKFIGDPGGTSAASDISIGNHGLQSRVTAVGHFAECDQVKDVPRNGMDMVDLVRDGGSLPASLTISHQNDLIMVIRFVFAENMSQ